MPPPNTAKLRSRLRWLLLLPIPLLWCVLNHQGAFTAAENRTVDWRFQFRGEQKPPANVIYVDVDSLSIDKIGSFPWTRSFFATVCSALVREGGVKAVGIDFVFSDAGMAESVDLRRMVEGNLEFGRFLQKSPEPPVVLAAAYGGWQFINVLGKRTERVLPRVGHDFRKLEAIEPPELPSFETSADPEKSQPWSPPFIGLIDTIDNGTRTVPAFAATARGTYYHLSLELARLWWGLPPGSIKVADDHVDFVRRDGTLVRRVPLRDGQLIDVNWFVHWNSLHTSHVEFADLYQFAAALHGDDPDNQKAAKAFFASGQFKDAVVLIGPVDPLLQDVAPTSLDDHAVPRVSVHGNMLMTILSGRFLHAVSSRITDVIIIGLSLLMAVCATAGGARAVFAKVLALAVVALYALAAFHAFDRWTLVLPLVAPVGAAFTTSFAGLVWQVVTEQKAKGRIKGMFGTYLAPTVVEQMIESGKEPELGGHDAEITAYFSDIQKFSSFSEVLSSSKLGELLNEYLTACTDIVHAERGTLDKYIGDAVVAMFGAPLDAPDHAFRACVASQLVQRRIGELRTKWQSEGEKWPELVHHLRTRIGLNTGVCMIGNMGSRTRFNYTMMGDNVNLAARMESGAKSWGVYTMCAESTKLACEKVNREAVVFRALGRIVVQGRSQPVPIYELVGLKADVTDAMRKCVGLFEQALQKYWARDWDGAAALFEQSRALEWQQPGRDPGISSNASLVYLKKVLPETRAETLPPDWDGRYVMHEK